MINERKRQKREKHAKKQATPIFPRKMKDVIAEHEKIMLDVEKRLDESLDSPEHKESVRQFQRAIFEAVSGTLAQVDLIVGDPSAFARLVQEMTLRRS